MKWKILAGGNANPPASTGRRSDMIGKEQRPDRPAYQARWLYLVGVAERLSALAREDRADAETALGEIETELAGLNEVFTRDIDPLSDLEGYGVHRFSQALLVLVREMRHARNGRRE